MAEPVISVDGRVKSSSSQAGGKVTTWKDIAAEEKGKEIPEDGNDLSVSPGTTSLETLINNRMDALQSRLGASILSLARDLETLQDEFEESILRQAVAIGDEPAYLTDRTRRDADGNPINVHFDVGSFDSSIIRTHDSYTGKLVEDRLLINALRYRLDQAPASPARARFRFHLQLWFAKHTQNSLTAGYVPSLQLYLVRQRGGEHKTIYRFGQASDGVRTTLLGFNQVMTGKESPSLTDFPTVGRYVRADDFLNSTTDPSYTGGRLSFEYSVDHTVDFAALEGQVELGDLLLFEVHGNQTNSDASIAGRIVKINDSTPIVQLGAV